MEKFSMKRILSMLLVIVIWIATPSAYATGTYLNLPDNWTPDDGAVKMAGDVYEDNKPAKLIPFKSVKEAHAVYFNFAHDIIQISDKTITYNIRDYGSTSVSTKKENKNVATIKSAKLVKGKVVYVCLFKGYESLVTLSKHADGRYLLEDANSPGEFDYYGNLSFLTRHKTMADLEKYLKTDKVIGLRAKQEVEYRDLSLAFDKKKAEKLAANQAFTPDYAKTEVNEKAPLQFEYANKDNLMNFKFEYIKGEPYVTIKTSFGEETDISEKFMVSKIHYSPVRMYFMLQPLEGSRFMDQKMLQLFVTAKERGSLTDLNFIKDDGSSIASWNQKTVELKPESVDKELVLN